MTKSLTPLLVVAVALVGSDGGILLQRRPEGTMHAGLWEFPGGKVEPGERPEEAAAREMHEELGLVLDPGALAPVGFASGVLGGEVAQEAGVEDPRARALVILLYAARTWQGEPYGREGAIPGWYAPEMIANLEMPPLDYPLAQALKGWLKHDF